MKDMSAEQLIRIIKSQAAEDALKGYDEFQFTAFEGELLSRLKAGERAVKAMEKIITNPFNDECVREAYVESVVKEYQEAVCKK